METTCNYNLAWEINRSWNPAFDGFFHMSEHARKRMYSRGLSPKVLEAVLTHGEVLYDRGALHFRIGRRVLREMARQNIDSSGLNGLHVIVSMDGAIQTVYRNHEFRRPGRHRLKVSRRWT